MRSKKPKIKDLHQERRTTHIDLYIGDMIRVERLKAGISQERLGAMVGVSFQQMQKYESGKNRVSAARLLLIALALKRKPADFFPPAIRGL